MLSLGELQFYYQEVTIDAISRSLKDLIDNGYIDQTARGYKAI